MRERAKILIVDEDFGALDRHRDFVITAGRRHWQR
jgi:hypothetical protein